MPWRGGFMRHHQQSEDLAHSSHAGILDCESCHNPHRSVVYGLGGTITHCTDCHPGNAENNNYVVLGMESLDCIDCHMPYMAKSATASNEFTGDVRGHLFRIMTEATAAEDNVYEENGSLFWNVDDTVNLAGFNNAAITLDYACLGCHIEFDPDFSLEDAAAYAKGIHTRQPPPAAGDTWLVSLPLLFTHFEMTMEQFAGILVLHATLPDGSKSVAIGMELDHVIFWMDISGNIFFGNINRSAGTMSGIMFGRKASSIWFAEQR
jgi:hypothetical protein